MLTGTRGSAVLPTFEAVLITEATTVDEFLAFGLRCVESVPDKAGHTRTPLNRQQTVLRHGLTWFTVEILLVEL